MQTSAMKAGFQIAECSFSSAKIAKKKQIKQGCFKQSCLKPSFFCRNSDSSSDKNIVS